MAYAMRPTPTCDEHPPTLAPLAAPQGARQSVGGGPSRLTMQNDTKPLLSVRNLRTNFFQDEGTTKAVDGASFNVSPAKTLGIVGESGCGKSVTAQ